MPHCIRRAAAIVKSAAAQGRVVVVVSAMSGVTNRLIQAAHRAEAGEQDSLPALIEELGAPAHHRASKPWSTIRKSARHIAAACRQVLDELDRLLRGTSLLRELTPRALDAISGIGERLSAPLVAGAISRARRAERSRLRHRSDRHRSASRPRRATDGAHPQARRSAPAPDAGKMESSPSSPASSPPRPTACRPL